METNKEEEKHPSDPPADTPQSSRQEEQLSNNCDNNSKDDKKDIGSETPNEKEEETPSKQRDNLPTAPSVNSIPSIPSSSPSFASPHGMISPYASFYNHPPAPHSTNASHFNRHNHAMLSSMKTFPEKLHQILDYAAQNGLEDIISFFSHGGAFKVHKPRRFVLEIMPRFFKQTKLTSFQRQLNLYGFKRISTGADNGGYYHPMFLKGQPQLAEQIKRQVQTKTARPKPEMRKVTPATAQAPPTLLPPYGAPPPHPHYYPYAPHAAMTPSYYPPHGMAPPNGSYPYGYPYMYGSGWPGAYGVPTAFTPYAQTQQEPVQEQSPPQHVMPQVSPVLSGSPPPSFTPIKLSSADDHPPFSWTPGGLCIDD